MAKPRGLRGDLVSSPLTQMDAGPDGWPSRPCSRVQAASNKRRCKRQPGLRERRACFHQHHSKVPKDEKVVVRRAKKYLWSGVCGVTVSALCALCGVRRRAARRGEKRASRDAFSIPSARRTGLAVACAGTGHGTHAPHGTAPHDA